MAIMPNAVGPNNNNNTKDTVYNNIVTSFDVSSCVDHVGSTISSTHDPCLGVFGLLMFES